MLEFRIGPLRVSINVPFLASLLLLMLADGGDIPLWCLIASLMHETGHILAVLLLQRQPVRVELGVFGMRMLQATDSMSYRRQMAVLLAGPMVNLGCAALLAATGQIGVVMGVHLVLGLFNLLPIELLDGGQALLCGLSIHGEVIRAERVVFILSLMGLFLLLVVGFYVLLADGYNYTLLAVTVYLGILLVCKHKR